MEVIMLVKCKICKNKVDRNEAYKAVVKGKNNYYCSIEEYVNWNEVNESRMRVIDLSFEIVGETTNTSLMKDLANIAKVHGYVKIKNYMEDNYDHIIESLERINFETEYNKIRYFTAIIKNSIGDYKEKQEEVEDVTVHNVDIVEEVNYVPTKKKSFVDLIDEY